SFERQRHRTFQSGTLLGQVSHLANFPPVPRKESEPVFWLELERGLRHLLRHTALLAIRMHFGGEIVDDPVAHATEATNVIGERTDLLVVEVWNDSLGEHQQATSAGFDVLQESAPRRVVAQVDPN